MLQIRRLHLASLTVGGARWPVHGFVVTHPGGAVLVDTGVGGPAEVLSDWRELLDGDAEVVPGLSVIATPGHTSGHQSVLVATAQESADVLIGDAAYTSAQYGGPSDDELPPGQASDPAAWRDSLHRIRAMAPARVHFCHDTDVIHR